MEPHFKLFPEYECLMDDAIRYGIYHLKEVVSLANQSLSTWPDKF